MSYTPTEWKKGDLITSEKLNKIEEGIVDAASSSGGGSGVFIVHGNNDGSNLVLDKTLGEIKTAFASETPIFLYVNEDDAQIMSYIHGYWYRGKDRIYEIYIPIQKTIHTLYAVEDSDYPTTEQPSSGEE